MTAEARTILGENGRVVIPAAYRKALGLKKGDELVVRLADGELRILGRRAAIERFRERVRQYVPDDVSLAGELHDERRAEAARE